MSRDRLVRIVRLAFLGLGISINVWLSGCAIFGSTEIQPKKASDYSVTAPKDWTQKDRGDGDYAYRLPSGAVVSLNSSCHRHLDVGLEVLTRQLMIGSRNVEYVRSEVVPVGKAQGLFTSTNATYEGTSFHLALFVLKDRECIFDFSLVNPKPISAQEEQAFFSFIKSFRYGTP